MFIFLTKYIQILSLNNLIMNPRLLQDFLYLIICITYKLNFFIHVNCIKIHKNFASGMRMSFE